MLRLAVLFFTAWLLSTQWSGLSTVFGAAVGEGLRLAGGTSPGAVGLVYLLGSLGLHAALCPLWFNWVPLSYETGPRRHPFPARPLRIHLRLRRVAFVSAALVEATALLLARRASKSGARLT